jgi:hypothetical protein
MGLNWNGRIGKKIPQDRPNPGIKKLMLERKLIKNFAEQITNLSLRQPCHSFPSHLIV